MCQFPKYLAPVLPRYLERGDSRNASFIEKNLFQGRVIMVGRDSYV